jgi:hypothetical protein
MQTLVDPAVCMLNEARCVHGNRINYSLLLAEECHLALDEIKNPRQVWFTIILTIVMDNK